MNSTYVGTPRRPLYQIAGDIVQDWFAKRAKSKRSKTRWQDTVYFGAVPYLEAMLTMDGTSDYGLDSPSSVVTYGLSNMSAYRGERARELKKELGAYSDYYSSK